MEGAAGLNGSSAQAALHITEEIKVGDGAAVCARLFTTHSKSGPIVSISEWLMSNLNPRGRTRITWNPVGFPTIVTINALH
jgi:hypothetical protein